MKKMQNNEVGHHDSLLVNPDSELCCVDWLECVQLIASITSTLLRDLYYTLCHGVERLPAAQQSSLTHLMTAQSLDETAVHS